MRANVRHAVQLRRLLPRLQLQLLRIEGQRRSRWQLRRRHSLWQRRQCLLGELAWLFMLGAALSVRLSQTWDKVVLVRVLDRGVGAGHE